MANLPQSGVVAGAAATFSLLMALEGFRWWVLLPYVHDATTEPRHGAGGSVVRTWTSGEQWERYLTLGDLSLMFMVLLARLVCFLIGLAVGRAVRYSSGFSGWTSVAIAFGLLLACLLAGTLPWVLNPWAHPGVRDEKLGFLSDYGKVLCYVFPFAIGCGYLGGALGSYLRPSTVA